MDRRHLPRSKLQGLVKIVDGEQTILGELVDVSLSGLSCHLAVDYDDTRPLLVSFRLSVKDRPITTWATPIWSVRQTDRYKIGMQFLDLDSAPYAAIADYVAAGWIQEHRV